MAQNRIDLAVSWVIARYAHARSAWKQTQPERSSLLYNMIGTSAYGENPLPSEVETTENYKKAETVGWIYSDIQLLAKEVSAAPISVKRLVGEQKVDIPNHPLEMLLLHPNEYMDGEFMWQYTVAWLSLRGDAFFYLAPEAGNPDTIAEIWPLRADKITPVSSTGNFVEAYLYRTNSGSAIKIDPRYVVHFMYPNPFSLLRGLSPLHAAFLAMETEIGTAKFQKDYYVSGRGIPQSILSVSPETNERDFIAIVAQIREEFQDERKVIVTRGGDMTVNKVGITQREMQLIDQRDFTKDEIDRIYLGVELHRKSTNEAELRQLDKMFKEKTVYPLHKLISGQLTVQIVHRFFERDLICEFDDIRGQDRALNVQERNVYWRNKTVNEARQDLNMMPYDNPDFPGLGDVLVPLATDPAFVAQLFGFSSVNKAPGSAGGLTPDSQRRLPSPNASMSESDAPVNQLSDTANGFKMIEAPEAAIQEGVNQELKRWQKVALKEIKAGRNPFFKEFSSDILPTNLTLQVRGGLWEAEKTDEAIKALFDTIKADLRGGGRGRRSKEITAVNAYQDELSQTYSDWADETAIKIAEAKDETDKKAIIAAALLLLLGSLQDLGRTEIPQAMFLAIGDNAPTTELLKYMADAVAENDKYLQDSFIPALRDKLEKALTDPDILLAFGMGKQEAIDALRSVMAVLDSRLAMYAGSWWSVYQYSYGIVGDVLGKGYRWNLDPLVRQHCVDCLEFGDTTYASFADCLAKSGGKYPSHGVACMNQCRCGGEYV